jgi:DNA repair and recombination protein RAD54B
LLTTIRRKPTGKKNKTWDGDGYLSVKNGYATLKDVSGRELGRTKWTNPLLPGSSLSIGGKEVEVDCIMSKQEVEANYSSSKKVSPPVKQSMTSSQSTGVSSVKNRHPLQLPKARANGNVKHEKSLQTKQPAPQRLLTLSQPSTSAFKSPMSTIPRMPSTGKLVPIPKHDALAQGAFVLPRISSVPRGKQLVDVVVDPMLSKHLRPHQKDGVKFLYECVMGMRMTEGSGAILTDEMGLGKTLQTIALIWTLLKQNPVYEAAPVVKKVLVVCPASLTNNWRKEFRKWLGNDRIGVCVLGNDKTSKITDFTRGRAYNVLIVGYEKLITIQDTLNDECQVDLIIADEGHRLKTKENKSYLAIKSFDTDKKIMLTGTPVQNNLSEFHAMVDLVNPGILSKYTTFKRDFENPIVKGRQPQATKEEVDQGEACSEELAELTAKFILRRSADVIAQYLPPKTETVLFCRPSPIQKEMYKSITESPAYNKIIGSAEASFQLINILKKLCNSPALLSSVESDETKPSELVSSLVHSVENNRMANNPQASAKLALLRSLLKHIRENTDEKVVIVSHYTSTLSLIERVLAGMSSSYLRLDGSVPTNKRQDLVDKFNKESNTSIFAFLLSAKAGGVGLNLIGASRLILFDLDWNPAIDLQAMSRIHRDGQRKPCFIYRFVLQGAIEEKMFQRQITKIGLSDTIVDSKKTAQGYTTEELRDLFTFNESRECQTHSLLGCDCKGLGNVAPTSSAEPRGWGTTMDDPAADQDDDEQQDDEDEDEEPSGFVTSTAILDVETRKDGHRKKLQANKVKRNMLGLMQYFHIDADEVRKGNEEVESLMEDQVLLGMIKENKSRVSFIFSRTNC